MPVFAVTYRYTDDVEARGAVRPSHREYLRGLADRGVLMVSGPYAATETPGALLLFRAGSRDEALAATAKDPFRVEGIVVEVTVTE